MADLSILVNGVRFPNPFIIGSGPPSTNARVMIKAFKAGWGGVVAKTAALTDSHVVNVQPRYGKLHSPSGDVVGFQNIELISDLSFEAWEGYYKETKDAFPDRPLIASIMECYNKDRWQEIAGRAAACGVDALELNFSCPHGHPESGMGAAMGQDPRQVEEVTRWVVEAVQIPVWAKMTPNITDITKPARSAVSGGASGISAINTVLGVIGINLDNLRPLPTVEGHSTPGGTSYTAVKPIALRMVAEIAQALPGVSISGIGGVTRADDAFEHILVGANTVQSCTGPMLQGFEMVEELISGLNARLDQHGFAAVADAVGKSLPFFTTHHHLVELQEEKRARQAAAQAAKAAKARSEQDTEWGKGKFEDEAAALTSDRS
jgi:dihydroorotate dehydrogenase subfamily 1